MSINKLKFSKEYLFETHSAPIIHNKLSLGLIVILASCEHHFIRVHGNLVQHLSNNISIIPTIFGIENIKKKQKVDMNGWGGERGGW